MVPYNLGDFLYRGLSSETNTTVLLEELARFTVEKHNKGINHLDFYPGNILVRFIENKFAFTLVDLNRIKFMSLNRQIRKKGLV